MIKTHVQKSHFCQTLLFACLDWRLHPELENYFKEKYGSFDLCSTAGSIKGFLEESSRNYFLKQIEISRKLHQSKTIILTLHHDCGAFGGIAGFKNRGQEFARHKEKLEKVRKIISNFFPDYRIEKYFLNLEFRKNHWLLSPRKIK